MSLPKFSVNQSLFVNLVSAIILLIGLIVLLGLNKEVFPNVNFDIVTINTVYPGATPLDVEKLVTVLIEKELRQVDGIKEINSSSATGMSLIYVKIDPDEKDKQKVVRDIQSAVDKVNNLPEDIDDEPLVTEISTKQYAIIEVSLSGDMPEKALQKHAEALEDILEDIEGAARITRSGYRENEIQILLDPEKLREYYVSFDEIQSALASRNINIPAGKIDTETTEYSIRTTGEFLTPEEVEDVIIRANDAGNWLRVKDVAKVVDGFKKEDVIDKTLGTRSINLVVPKKESGDALNIVDKIKKECGKYLEHHKDGLNISYINDYSFYAKRRLDILRNNAWAAIFIVISILMVFLQKRVAILTFLGVPVALFTTFIVMSIFGITINMISMFGLIIVLGMLVDDGIVVAENVYRYMEEGIPPRQAAVKGTEEVMGAVATAVFTTIAAFAPLLFMTGLIGKFIRNIPTVVIVALLASLAEAFVILPSHLADFTKVRVGPDGKAAPVSKELPWFKGFVSFYTNMVQVWMKRKYLVLGAFVVALAAAAALGFGAIKFVLFPSAGINFLFIRAEAPIGTPLEKMHELILPIEGTVSKLPKSEVETYVTTVGKIQEDQHDPFAGKASNMAQITVYLTPEQNRKRKADEIIAQLRQDTKDVKGFDELRFDMPQAGPPVGKPVEARIRGEHFDTLDKIAAEYMAYLKSIDGTSDVTWDHKPGKEEIRVEVNREKATMAGLSMQQIARTVRSVFEGGIATNIKPVKAEEETDVTVMFDEDDKKDMSVFDNILIRNSFGNLTPLKKVASVEKKPGTTTIKHLGGKRVVTASCNIDTDKVTSIEVNSLLQKKFKDIPQRYPGYSVSYMGEQQETIESLQDLGMAFLYAFLIVYLMLASFFKSLIQPFVVMLAIPFGLIGVVFAFLIHGTPFSFMAIMGIIGLSGIVVNDSIVLVSFINSLRRSGMERRDSIIKAGQMRIRPVILTTITTVGGLCTVAYGIGGKDPFLVPMALAVCWGLLFSTVLTLLIIPCIYSILDDWAIKLTHHTSMIRVEKVNSNHS